MSMYFLDLINEEFREVVNDIVNVEEIGENERDSAVKTYLNEEAWDKYLIWKRVKGLLEDADESCFLNEMSPGIRKLAEQYLAEDSHRKLEVLMMSVSQEAKDIFEMWKYSQATQQARYEHLETESFETSFEQQNGRKMSTAMSGSISQTSLEDEDEVEKYVEDERETVERLEDIKPRLADLPANLNILIVGETGMGKSTFVNGLVNYLKNETLNDAMGKEASVLVEAKFNLTDDDNKKYTIKCEPNMKEDDGKPTSNECFEDGQSCTQEPRMYSLVCGPEDEKRIIRVIDTPGMGDTRGIEQDRKNMNHILAYMENLKELNAICVVLRSNMTTLSQGTRMCIDEFIGRLPPSAARNVVFCFTNSRETQYYLGDSLPTVEKHLESVAKNDGVKVYFNQETRFTFDNESLRFLFASKNQMPYSGMHKSEMSMVWRKSVKEMRRFLWEVSQLPAHRVDDTLSLNRTKNILNCFADELRSIVDTQTEKSKNHEKTNSKKLPKSQLAELRKELQELNKETESLPVICAEFSTFLTHNSVVEKRDPFEREMNELIRKETVKAGTEGETGSTILPTLKKLRADYLKKLESINNQVDGGERHVRTEEEIREMIEELSKTSIIGSKLDEIVELHTYRIPDDEVDRLQNKIRLHGVTMFETEEE